jgi:hypothetical protein
MMPTNQRLCEMFEYKDGVLYRKISVQGAPKGIKSGISKSNGYEYSNVDGKKILNHRIIFALHHGYAPELVDHIDGNKKNNLIENLREATKAENNLNRKIHKNNKCGKKNIHWIQKVKSWCVKLNVNKKRIHVGLFKDLELAELVAIEAREKYHKHFANHGFKGASA